jgi:hypothetical protein
MTDFQPGTKLRLEVLVAFQAALLDMVTPNLRGVSVDWTLRQIKGICIYDGEVTESEEEIVSDIEGEVISHFSDLKIELKAVSSTASMPLDQYSLNVWVYRRAE